MISPAPKSLELSLRVYRRLLGVYPAGFLGQFGDQLAQTFADQARRALLRGGAWHLLLLWMRTIPDLGSSAIREHLNATTWTAPARLRFRWVIACSLGCGFGFLSATWASELGNYYFPLAHSFLFMLVLGLFQSVHGLKLPSGLAARWTLATIAGMFLFALPVRTVMLPEGVAGAIVLVFLRGLGIGFCQFLVLRKASFRAWYWIPATALGAAGAEGLTLSGAVLLGYEPDVTYVLPFVAGAVLGCLTLIPLQTILRPRDAAPSEGTVQSA